MFFTIYKITNKINNKFYIGMHQTTNLNDGYMGSGKLIKRAIEKHGIENFTKEILHVFDNPDDMKLKEAELVTQELIESDMSYNLCPGGHGGWGYVNQEKLFLTENHKRATSKNGKIVFENVLIRFNNDKEYRDAQILIRKNGLKKYIEENGHWWNGKCHSEETKEKIGKANSISQSGKNNSQYGTIWISNGIERKKIKKDETIPEGWYRGRK